MIRAIDVTPGGDVVQKGELSMPTEGANNFGTQGSRLSEIAKAKWYSGIEGAPISRLANRIPGINAVAGLHDVFQINLGPSNGFWRNVLNIPGMPVAAGITYAGMASGVPLRFCMIGFIFIKNHEGLQNSPDNRSYLPPWRLRQPIAF